MTPHRQPHTPICLDVWGGENSSKHIARYMLAMGEAMKRAEQELKDGYLVNLRLERAWGIEQDFDSRLKVVSNAALKSVESA